MTKGAGGETLQKGKKRVKRHQKDTKKLTKMAGKSTRTALKFRKNATD